MRSLKAASISLRELKEEGSGSEQARGGRGGKMVEEEGRIGKEKEAASCAQSSGERERGVPSIRVEAAPSWEPPLGGEREEELGNQGVRPAKGG